MTERDVRNWLGIYFLVVTTASGGYILLFADTRLLPGLTRPNATSIFEIIIPVLIGQLTVIFRWYGNQTSVNSNAPIDLPTWVVKAPPLLVSLLLAVSVLMLIVGNNREHPWGPSAESFAAIVTFCVSILNATTIFIVSRFFGDPKKQARAPGRKQATDADPGE